MAHRVADERPEITDLIVDYDPVTLERRPVRRDAVVEVLKAKGMGGAARIVSRFPVREGGVLDEAAVDRLFVSAHCELQRLEEEFLQGERVLSLLGPAVRMLGGKARVVDVGCGLGFVVRWLSKHGGFGDRVELMGCDYNQALITAAREAVNAEKLRCSFQLANAFRLEQPATVFTSSGFLHHFRGDALGDVFARMDRPGTEVLIHFDIKQSWLAPIGAWIFHEARMREPVARHDGTLSAVRAHSGETLLAQARRGAPGFKFAMFDGEVGLFPMLRTLQAIVGVRPERAEAFRAALGPIAHRLGAFA